MGKLQDRNAVVTGAGSGLGAALARALADAGARTWRCSTSMPTPPPPTRRRSPTKSVSPRRRRASTSGTPRRWSPRPSTCGSTLGGCDVLCSNVGVQQFGAIDKLTEQDWQWVLNVNVLGTVRTVREFLPMLRRGAASGGSCSPHRRACSHRRCDSARTQTSKFAVLGFAESLREEIGDEGIGVTVLFPGGMMTRHLESSVEARPSDLGESCSTWATSRR